MVKAKKIGLGEFLGDQAAAYIPGAQLPSAPRVREEGDDGNNYRRGGDRYSSDRFGDREPLRSEQSGQWRGDRSGPVSSGRYGGDRDGGDRFGDRFGGGSRYDRPSRDDFQAEERPAHMRLNLSRRSTDAPASGDVRNSSSGGDKWSNAFGGGGRAAGRFASGGDRFGGDRFEGGGRAAGRFARGGDEGLSSGMSNMRVSDASSQQRRAPAPEPEMTEKQKRAQKKREERKKKAEEERLAAEEAKRVAAEKKKQEEEAAAKKAEVDRETMKQVLASGKKGEELAEVAKELYAKLGRPSGAVLFESVLKAAEDVAKARANWIQPSEYGELLRMTMESADKQDQLQALYSLQIFLNGFDFPKGVMEKCFMALYSLDIIEDSAFFEYKYDVDSETPGRMKAIIQTSNWLTWLETPEEESDEEEEDAE